MEELELAVTQKSYALCEIGFLTCVYVPHTVSASEGDMSGSGACHSFSVYQRFVT